MTLPEHGLTLFLLATPQGELIRIAARESATGQPQVDRHHVDDVPAKTYTFHLHACPCGAFHAAQGLILLEFGNRAPGWLLDTNTDLVMRKDLAHSSRVQAISADGRLAYGYLSQPGKNPVQVSYRLPGFEISARFEGLPHPSHLSGCTWWRDRWLGIEENKRTSRLHVVDTNDVQPRVAIDIPGVVTSLDVARAGTCAIAGLAGGRIAVIDLEAGACHVLNPRPRTERGWLNEVAISDDGHQIASLLDKSMPRFCRKDESGWATCLAPANAIAEPDELGRNFPKMTWVGDRLALADNKPLRLLQPDHSNGCWEPATDKPRQARRRTKIDAMAVREKAFELGMDTVCPQLAELLLPRIAFDTGKPTTLRKNFPEGLSRLGGYPDLPSANDWPVRDGIPMAFLGQLNLADIARAAPDNHLPAKGLLSFFLACSEEYILVDDEDGRERTLVDVLAGQEPSQTPGWKVLYHPDTGALRSTAPPEGRFLPQVFRPCTAKLHRGMLSLPDEEAISVAALLTDLTARNAYLRLREFTGDEDEAQAAGDHQLLGHPAWIQADESSADWQLLLQLNEDENPGFIWGDGGAIYFFARREALARGDFSETFYRFQCH